jgi:hypothetical protein
MFGLENQKKKKKKEDFVFDLENELKVFKSHQNLKGLIEDRVHSIREILRKGDQKEDFDKIGVLLHGYTSFLKVMSRLTPKA